MQSAVWYSTVCPKKMADANNDDRAYISLCLACRFSFEMHGFCIEPFCGEIIYSITKTTARNLSFFLEIEFLGIYEQGHDRPDL